MLNDLRFSLRQIVKSPGFTFIAVFTLALGIGANTAIFSLINALLLKPLPYPDSEQLVNIRQSVAGAPDAGPPVFGGSFLDFEVMATQFESLSYDRDARFTLSEGIDPISLSGYRVSANYLQTLGIKPAIGNDFTPESELPGGDTRVVILSDTIWKIRFGSDPNLIGRSIELDFKNYTVIGVLPPNALLFPSIDFLTPGPLRTIPRKSEKNFKFGINVIARLKDGATTESAQNELLAIKERTLNEYPDPFKHFGFWVKPMQEVVTKSYKPYALSLLVAVGLVLLVACANVANLLLAKATGRRREISTRAALGAPPWKMARQLLCESTLLALLGGILGLVLGIVSLQPLAFMVGLDQVQNFDLQIDLPVLFFTLAISLATGIVFGAFPAFKAIGLSSAADRKNASRAATSASGNKIQATLIVTEIALTVVLLASIGLLFKSLSNAFQTDPGFNDENLLTFEISRSGARSKGAEGRVQFTEQILDRIEQVPGVKSAAMTTNNPMKGTGRYWHSMLWRDDQPEAANTSAFMFETVNGDLFQSLEIPLISGRYFDKADQKLDAPRVMIVNKKLAESLFSETDPIGQIMNNSNEKWTIVGVVGTIRPEGLDLPEREIFYIPQITNAGTTSYLVKTQLPPMDLVREIEAAIHEIDPQQPIDRVRTLEEATTASVQTRSSMIVLLGIFGGVAILLAATGIYGLMTYLVKQRNREIGIRLAIGALPQEIIGMVLKRGLSLVAIGIAIGIAIVLGLGRYLAFFLYQVEPYDLTVLLGVSLFTLLIALVACWIPAKNASSIHPSQSLQLG